MRAVFGLGSNLGDRVAHLTAAVRGLARLGTDLRLSPLYQTEPVGGPDGQGPYLNCVASVETDLAPRDLLDAAWQLETAAGRVRTVKDGPRTLDVDVLLVGTLKIDEPELTVPHPRMFDRAFVLAPLEDLAPELVPGGWRERLGGAGTVDRAVKRIGTLVVG